MAPRVEEEEEEEDRQVRRWTVYIDFPFNIRLSLLLDHLRGFLILVSEIILSVK